MADPYAAIRYLPFLQVVRPAGFYIHESEAGVTRTPYPGQVLYELATDFLSPDQKPFQSKYNEAETLADGTVAVTLQQVGAHKYDTMLGIYQMQGAAERVNTLRDETGQEVPVYRITGMLMNDPMDLQTRQESSAHANWETIGTAAAVLAAAYGAGALASAAMGAGAGAGASSAASAAGASGIAPVSAASVAIPAAPVASSAVIGGGAAAATGTVSAGGLASTILQGARTAVGVSALVNQGLQTVQAYRQIEAQIDAIRDGAPTASASGTAWADESGYLVTRLPDGTTRRELPPVGTAYRMADGRALVNNGDGTYAIVDQTGSVSIRRYPAHPANADGAGVIGGDILTRLRNLSTGEIIGVVTLVAMLASKAR